jgi:hypothetical protein
MGSRVTTPDGRLGVARRLATVLPVFFFVAIVASGCPDRQSTLSISSNGVVTLRQACRDACTHIDDGGIEPSCACDIVGRHPPDLEHHTTQARLFLITPSDNKVRDSSKCMTLLPCADAGKPVDCLAESLNQQLDGALPNGLSFDGLENPDDVQLVLAFYQSLDAASVAPCSRTDLVACAGLAPPLGGGNYDITCASCEGGPKGAPGPDNGPCPRPKDGGCFLNACNDILSSNGL